MERKRLHVDSMQKISFNTIVLVCGEVKVGVTRDVNVDFADG